MMLLKFEEQVNVKKDILTGIQAENWYKLTGDKICDDSYWLIGRESDHGGTFIFKYDTISQKWGNKRRTHIGVYRNFQEQKVRTLYTFQAVEDIVQCTVNKTSTQMVMCLSENIINKTRGSSRANNSDFDSVLRVMDDLKSRNYTRRVYLVDLVGVFPILDSNKYEVKILDPTAPKQAQFLTLNNDEREQRFIVFEENSIISLYEVRCDSNGSLKKDNIELIQPSITLGPAVWYQWDIERQFLYVIPTTNDSTLTLQVYQPSDSHLIDHVFNINFKMSLPEKCLRSTRLCLDRRPFGRNMVLLTSNSGLMCLCQQFKSTQTANSDKCTVIYEIHMFLQSQTTVVKVPGVPEMAKKRPIHFSLYGSYILAYLPGIFANLINVNELMEPGPLNLVWKQRVQHIEAGQSGSLSMLPNNTLCRRLGACFYDSKSMKIYQARINEETLVEMFKFNPLTDIRMKVHFTEKPPPSLKLSVLHHVLMTGPDTRILQELLHSMLNNATDPEVNRILKEYIIGSSFAIANRRHGSLFSRMIPFSSSEFLTTYSIKFDGSSDSDASSIHFENKKFRLVLKEIKRGFSSASEFLKLHLVKQHIHRYETKNINKEKIEIIKRTKSKKKKFSFFKKEVSGDGGITPYVATPESSALFFPGTVVNDEISTNKPFIKQLGVIIHESCYKRLLDKSTDMRHYNGFDSKGQKQAYLEKFVNYSQILIVQCVELFSLLYQACDLVKSDSSNLYYIRRTAVSVHTKEDRITLNTVLMIFERYKYIVTEIGLPLPTEFPTFFTTIAYQALTTREFLNYVDIGLVELTDKFLEVLCNDSESDKASLRLDCFSRLPDERALIKATMLSRNNKEGISGFRFLVDHTVKTALSGGVDNTSTSEKAGEFDQIPTYGHLISLLKPSLSAQKHGVDMMLFENTVFHDSLDGVRSE